MRRLAAAAVMMAVVAACDGGAEGPATSSAPPTTSASAPSTTAGSFAGVRPAPEFPTGLDWLNVDAPLTLAGLRGKVVLLDFWTYGCVNCIHVLPDLERLEAEYADELVVIGVHSAKFTNEGQTENIRRVVVRYGIEHPVVNDAGFAVWDAWGTSAWPTTVLIDPAGNVVGGHSGEGVYEVAEPVIASLIAEFDATGELDRTPLVDLALEVAAQPDRALTFPGKVLAEPDGRRLFIADTGRNRIVVADRRTGAVTAVYGSGRAGFEDGTGTAATFDAPQGMALAVDGGLLYVADTGNHAVRAVDTVTGRVDTVVGTGERGYPPEPGSAPDVAIASPWDLALDGDTLYVAMAGTHQIWAVDLTTMAAQPVVGSSAEGVRNGSLDEAELAQPSGLALVGDTLYFADSESSSIRAADLAAGETALVAGASTSLFDFGAVDGVGDEARFQHPLGVAAVDDTTLLVADTYNSLIRRVTPATGLVTTWLGAEPGWRDGPQPRFDEPGGISVENGTAYVADTNNHAVRVIDLATGATTTLVLGGIEAFEAPPGSADYRGTVVDVGPVTVSPGSGTLVVDVTLPAGFGVNGQAPSSLALTASSPVEAVGAGGGSVDLTGAALPAEIPVRFFAGGDLTADLTLVYCEKDTPELCLIEQVRFEAALTVGGPDATDRLTLTHRVVLPDLG